jgi:hypothetical protein
VRLTASLLSPRTVATAALSSSRGAGRSRFSSGLTTAARRLRDGDRLVRRREQAVGWTRGFKSDERAGAEGPEPPSFAFAFESVLQQDEEGWVG